MDVNRGMIVGLSAETAAAQVGTAIFAKQTEVALKLCGHEIARHVDPNEPAGLFAPLFVERDGTEHPGAVLILRDRAVIAWAVGLVRVKNFDEVVPLGSIKRVDRQTLPDSRLSGSREVLRVDADQHWRLVFSETQGPSIAFLVGGLLDGSLKPTYGSNSDPRDPAAEPGAPRETADSPLIAASKASATPTATRCLGALTGRPQDPINAASSLNAEPQPAAAAAAPGWYEDPIREADLRWWDGAAWTADARSS